MTQSRLESCTLGGAKKPLRKNDLTGSDRLSVTRVEVYQKLQRNMKTSNSKSLMPERNLISWLIIMWLYQSMRACF